MKTIDLALAVLNNKKCLGFIWRFKNGRYGFQNDNDLGLDIDGIKGKQKYIKKLFFKKGYYVYQICGGFEDDGTGAGLATIKALLKNCHSHLFTLSKHEQKLCTRYYGF